MKKLLFALSTVAVMAACSAGPTSEKIKSASTLGELTSINLKVAGMTCTGCEKTIETGLGQLEGVASVDAVFTDSTTTIKADTTKVSLARLEQTIEALGYTVLK
jgi:copper chaperone CopZ